MYFLNLLGLARQSQVDSAEDLARQALDEVKRIRGEFEEFKLLMARGRSRSSNYHKPHKCEVVDTVRGRQPR